MTISGPVPPQTAVRRLREVLDDLPGAPPASIVPASRDLTAAVAGALLGLGLLVAVLVL